MLLSELFDNEQIEDALYKSLLLYRTSVSSSEWKYSEITADVGQIIAVIGQNREKLKDLTFTAASLAPEIILEGRDEGQQWSNYESPGTPNSSHSVYGARPEICELRELCHHDGIYANECVVFHTGNKFVLKYVYNGPKKDCDVFKSNPYKYAESYFINYQFKTGTTRQLIVQRLLHETQPPKDYDNREMYLSKHTALVFGNQTGIRKVKDKLVEFVYDKS